jgi:secreted trypsin-like serine protease
LEKKLVFDETFSPICLSADTNVDSDLFTAGWGLQHVPKVLPNRKFDFSSVPQGDRALNEIPVRVIPENECLALKLGTRTDYQICVKGLEEGSSREVKSGTCVGDSGSPLMGRQNGRVVVIGVGSTTDCNTRYKISTYENLSVHKEWIADITKDGVWCQGSSTFFG